MSTLLRKGISGTTPQWFESYLSDRSFKVSWRGEIQVATSSYWGASGLSSWTTSLLCLHGITRFCHSETWVFISLLCWWHSTLPLIPSWWSDDSCSHLSMSNRHFLLDEGPFKIHDFYLSHTWLYREYITSSEMWVRSAPWTVQIL